MTFNFDREKVERVKAAWPPGTRIELRDLVNYEAGMPSGLRGTVTGVDAQPALLMRWDNGRTLSLLMEDSFRRLRPDEVEAEQYGNITAVCDKKAWLGNYREYPAGDYGYTFEQVDDLGTLAERFQHGNWSIRTGFLYGGLAFVQQSNGGDDWLTLRQTAPGEWESFESISMWHILRNRGQEAFESLVNRLVDEHGVVEPVQEQNKIKLYCPIQGYHFPDMTWDSLNEIDEWFEEDFLEDYVIDETAFLCAEANEAYQPKLVPHDTDEMADTISSANAGFVDINGRLWVSVELELAAEMGLDRLRDWTADEMSHYCYEGWQFQKGSDLYLLFPQPSMAYNQTTCAAPAYAVNMIMTEEEAWRYLEQDMAEGFEDQGFGGMGGMA